MKKTERGFEKKNINSLSKRFLSEKTLASLEELIFIRRVRKYEKS